LLSRDFGNQECCHALHRRSPVSGNCHPTDMKSKVESHQFVGY
jgi:hypothetical protein